MRVLRKREQVRDNRIIIKTPEEFNRKEVDIIVIPVMKKKRQFKSWNLISINIRGIDLDRDELHRG